MDISVQYNPQHITVNIIYLFQEVRIEQLKCGTQKLEKKFYKSSIMLKQQILMNLVINKIIYHLMTKIKSKNILIVKNYFLIKMIDFIAQ